jgi:DNA excision repair protein ERCC-3
VQFNPANPLIVQGDMEILVEVANPFYEDARDAIAPFTELVKSPEHLHTYKISALSLWNAAASGHSPEQVMERLNQYSKFPVPENVSKEILETMARYGLVRLVRHEGKFLLEGDDEGLMNEIWKSSAVNSFFAEDREEDGRIEVLKNFRGPLKMAMAKQRFPVEDLAGYITGASLEVKLRDAMVCNGKPFAPRDYQNEAANVFYASGGIKGGSGVIVLPCGAGKTIVGIASMALAQTRTLILSPNIIAARQWRREIMDKTELTEDQVKEYSGERKEIGDVTVATYQILTSSTKKGANAHFDLFEKNKWGLVIYDEVHLLPAPVFRLCAEMQATRRLGLTATLVREDGKETEVFSLIGPKKYDLPWKGLENDGWIAKANCTEVRIPLHNNMRMEYAMAPERERIKQAACNPRKFDVIKELMAKHNEDKDRVLIIGQYISQLNEVAAKFDLPLITGKTPNKKREELYFEFREGRIPCLILSKVGNFAVDLPDANVLIQISGTFGSRQEEAQRLGRVLRPKSDGRGAWFYSVISQDTKEQEFAMNRQLFLAEQGYQYDIEYRI